MDQYGFGNTPHPDRPLIIDDYAESILEIVRKYQMKNVTLICHSFGGRVGIKLCAFHGEIFRTLVLADSAGIKPRKGFRYYYRVVRHKVLSFLRLPHEAGSEDYKKMRGTMRETFKNVVGEDETNLLKRISARTLLVWGNKDKDTPIYMGKKLHKGIAGSILLRFAGCGHFAYLENGDVFCEAVERFLSQPLSRKKSL